MGLEPASPLNKSNRVLLLSEIGAERRCHCLTEAALCNATIVPRSLRHSISSRWASLTETVRQQSGCFCRDRKAFCTCTEREQNASFFFPFVILDLYDSFIPHSSGQMKLERCLFCISLISLKVLRFYNVWRNHCTFTLFIFTTSTPPTENNCLNQCQAQREGGRQLTGLLKKAMLSNFSLCKGLTIALAWAFLFLRFLNAM